MSNRLYRALALLGCFVSISARGADPIPADQLLKDVHPKSADAWDVSMLASPPDITYPVNVCSSPWGEFFVATDCNGVDPREPDRGWVTRFVVIDGKATHFTRFAKMDSPRGIVNDGDTIYVLHPPFITAYKDDPKTGVAASAIDLIKGVGVDLKTMSANHEINGLRMGIDGWLYIVCGDYGAKNAVSLTDGQSLQLHGGGILRFRPDGTELEMFVHGTRNMYDMAITPTLDMFTRDNTNDGGGWNSRLAQMVNGGNYGYPGLFKNFGDEIILPMADYGGGAATGSIWITDPLFPKDLNNALITNDWARGWVYSHALTRDGAGYKATQQELIHMSNPIGIDADGLGNLYITSWKGTAFNYNGPWVGYIVRFTPKGAVAPKFPDLKTAGDDELVALMESPQATWRLQTQREILRRGSKPVFVTGMEKLAENGASIEVKVAAIFTLKQLEGPKSHEFLLKLVKNEELREYALHALADRKKEAADLPVEPFVTALADANPRVRLQATIAIGRLGRKELADSVLPLTGDKDPIVAHVAVSTLVAMDAYEACFKGIDSSSPTLQIGSFAVLQQLHEEPVVAGLIDRLPKLTDPAVHELAFATLCRLTKIEATWDGKWWGTVPDTRGPYYHPVDWDQTEKVKQALTAAIDSASADAQVAMASTAFLNRVDIPRVMELARKNAQTDPKLKAALLRHSLDDGDVSDEALASYQTAASDPKEDPTIRILALRGMLKAYDKPANLDNLVSDFAGITDKSDNALKNMWNEFVHDNRNGNNSAYFLKVAAEDNAARRDLAYGVLVYMAGSNFTKRDVKNNVNAFLVSAWKIPKSAISLLHAITRLKDDRYATEIQDALKDADPDVQKAAATAIAAVHPPDKSAAPTIATMTFDDMRDAALKEKGDPKLGAELFARLGCINCHTVNKGDPPKGPFLGGIGQKNSRADLIESVLKPSAKIAQGFITQTFDMNDGTQVQGFVFREAGDEIEVRNVQGISTVLKKSDIKSRGQLNGSIMPNGLADKITVQDFASLLAYLESLP